MLPKVRLAIRLPNVLLTPERATIQRDIRSYCSSEKYSEGYFVIDVPYSLNYAAVQNKLIELQNAGVLDYAEPCLSKKHGSE